MRATLFLIAIVHGAISIGYARPLWSGAHLEATAQDTRRTQFVVLPVPDFKRSAARPGTPTTHARRLVQVSSRPNNITDTLAWFTKNNLSLPLYSLADAPFEADWPPIAPLPASIPLTFEGNMLVKAIRQPRATLLVYGQNPGEGRYLVAVDPVTGAFRNGYDFVNYAYAPGGAASQRDYVYQNIDWAVANDRTLYVAHSHSTYARSSNGLNAYITAIDTQTNRVLWRSQPLVSNAANFEIVDDLIVSGYGFTNEPDFLYLLDKKTGAVVQRLRVKSGPTYIINQSGRIQVRTYDADLVMRLADSKSTSKSAR